MKLYTIYGLVILLMVTNISGCATSRMYAGPAMPADQVAFLERGDLAQILKQVDENKNVNFFMLNSAVELLPGKHTIAVGYGDGKIRADPYALTFTAKPGVRYVIKSNFMNSYWEPSIFEKESKIKVNEQPINLIPMYGAPEIVKTEEQKRTDKEFIESIVKSEGSREIGAKRFAVAGWMKRQKGNTRASMMRFNQAWLLDPESYHSYWGFGTLMLDENKPVEASFFLEKALSLIDEEEEKSRLFVEAARAYGRQAAIFKESDTKKAKTLYKKANALIDKALVLDSDYNKTYRIGAIISYDQTDYMRAWDIVKKSRETGAYKFDSEFIEKLSKELPEP